MRRCSVCNKRATKEIQVFYKGHERWLARCKDHIVEGYEGKIRNVKQKKSMISIIILSSFIILSFLMTISAARYFYYVPPSPNQGDILNGSRITINVSIVEDSPSTNCVLNVVSNNNTKKYSMSREGDFCYYNIMELSNNTNYTVYMTAVIDNDSLVKGGNLNFSTKLSKSSCNINDLYGIRNCVVNGLEGIWTSVLVTVIIICLVILLIDYIKGRMK